MRALRAALLGLSALMLLGAGEPALGGEGRGVFSGAATGLLERERHVETSGYVVDSKDVYEGRFTYSFRIVGAALRGGGKGDYVRATWRLDGSNQGQPFGCDVPMTTGRFRVAVSGTATATRLILRFRLLGAREANADYDCGAGLTGFASDDTRLADSLQLVQRGGIVVSRTSPRIPTLRRVETIGEAGDRRIDRHTWTFTIRRSDAAGSTGQPVEGQPATCFGLTATVSTPIGTEGDDVIVGGDGDDTLRGLGGNDRICGGGGDDRILGGDGDDLLEGAVGDDSLDGGAGNDRLQDHAGENALRGGDGDDYLLGGAERDRLAGNAGDDELLGGGGADRLDGGRGDDVLRGQDGGDRLDGGRGSDRVHGGPGRDELDEQGAQPSGTLCGTSTDVDVLLGEAGDDRIGAGWCVDPSGSRLEGGPGDDRLRGGDFRDLIYGGPGNDFVVLTSSGPAPDRVYAGPGDDTVQPAGFEGGRASGDDVVSGGDGRDRLRVGHGDDVVHGGGDDDTIDGGRGDDDVRGGAGDDTIDGGRGGDRLLGETGDDRLHGGPGLDDLTGGAGTDDCQGEQTSECE